MNITFSLLCTIVAMVFSCVVCAQEPRLRNIQQRTFGGDNAEAYWNFSGTALTLQSNAKKWGNQCDQIFFLDVTVPADSAFVPQQISTGKGRTTCSYFLPGDSLILYSSTHQANAMCPPEPPARSDKKYLWSIYPSYDIYIANTKGELVTTLINSPGYDAEATVSPDGSLIVFTSDRSGDLELYTMHIDGSNIRQITFGLGYDGGAFFSPDSKRIVFRASRPTSDSAKQEYLELLQQGLVAPTEMEIFTCAVDGSNLQQVTFLGKANWAPFFTPNGKQIIFASNHASQRGYNFQLYTIGIDGKGLEQITTESNFNAFPMFSPDGKKLVWSSNRNNGGTRDTNVFIADWVD
jgi:TolB protein